MTKDKKVNFWDYSYCYVRVQEDCQFLRKEGEMTQEKTSDLEVTEREALKIFSKFIENAPEIKKYLTFNIKYSYEKVCSIMNELEEKYPGIKEYIYVRCQKSNF